MPSALTIVMGTITIISAILTPVCFIFLFIERDMESVIRFLISLTSTLVFAFVFMPQCKEADRNR